MEDKPWLFKKGMSGNPAGRMKVSKEVKEFRETTYKNFIEYLQLFGSITKPELERILNSSQTTNFQHIFGKVVLGAANGDRFAREVLLDRLWGKVRNEISIDNQTTLKAEMAKLSDAQLLRIAQGEEEEEDDSIEL